MKIIKNEISSSSRANLRKKKDRDKKALIFSYSMKGLEALHSVLRIIDLIKKLIIP